ncbi:MAG: hypothetical protein L0I76_16255 [Pseudonocardia sp.]|nr:hypothetical protein [Pseudonocardia sp.]
MDRPSLRACIDALLITDPSYPHIGPAEEEADVAAVLESVEAAHQGAGDEPDRLGLWGGCVCCETPWPCEPWWWAQTLAVQFLGRAADRVAASALGPDALPRPDHAALPRPHQPSPRRGPDEAELMRLRYPPDGDVERWVREGPAGHVNYPGRLNTEDPA